jgi:hypothetical protein
MNTIDFKGTYQSSDNDFTFVTNDIFPQYNPNPGSVKLVLKPFPGDNTLAIETQELEHTLPFDCSAG